MSTGSTVRATVGPVVRPVAGVGEGAWTPATLAALVRARFLDNQKYADSTLSGLQVLKPQELYGSFRAPRQGRVYKGDGTDDYGVSANNIGITGAAPRTITFWAKLASTGVNQSLVGFGTNTEARMFVVSCMGGNWVGNAWGTQDFYTSIAADTSWHHHALIYTGTAFQWYIDGVSVSSFTATLNTLDSQLNVLRRVAQNDQYSSASIHDIRIYNVAKSAPEVAAIYAGDYEDPDRTGLVAGYWGNEESGTTSYDWSGNNNHITWYNITQATFHAVDTGVTRNANNVHGYRLSAGVYIPANLASPTLAADGNALTVTGKSPHPATVEVPCVTGDGSAVYVAADVTGIDWSAQEGTFCCWYKGSGSSGTYGRVNPDVAANNNHYPFSGAGDIYDKSFTTGRIGPFTTAVDINTWHHLLVTRRAGANGWNFYQNGALVHSTSGGTWNTNYMLEFLKGGASGAFSAGSICDARLYNKYKTAAQALALAGGYNDTDGLVRHYPLQEGPGTSSTNRTVYDVSNNANHGTIVNGTVANIWANRCPYVRDWCVEYGGALNANLLTYTNKFDSWIFNGSPTVTQGVAPPLSYGGNAWTWTRVTTASSWHGLGPASKAAATKTYTASYYVKKNVGNYFAFRIQGTYPARADIVVNLDAGTIHQAATVYFGFSNASGSITPLANGWYRVTLTATTDATTTLATYFSFNSNGVEIDLVDSANNSSGYIFGAQLEEAPQATPYRHNVASPGDKHIPARPDRSAAADGSAITLPAGKFGNPFSRLNMNPFTAAELNGRSIPTAYAVGGSLASVTPADSAFRRTDTDGDDRFLITTDGLTGSNLTNEQAYVS